MPSRARTPISKLVQQRIRDLNLDDEPVHSLDDRNPEIVRGIVRNPVKRNNGFISAREYEEEGRTYTQMELQKLNAMLAQDSLRVRGTVQYVRRIASTLFGVFVGCVTTAIFLWS